ncbi:MAG: tRNA guanosine(34) transglycosylase Tgt [Patescibacteria group bacterium]|nr:tRNA guanosine(34) transglycosylase Tgt [Patescibacteria group bacterium]
MKQIQTKHGNLKLPFFMPDATRAFLKTCNSNDIINSGIEAMVVNTFHLYLQPGLKIIKKAGGIHNFMNWQKPLVSDSGGFQIFSLIHKNKKMGKIDDAGASFKSPLNGSSHYIGPEKSIQIQFELGTDFIVCLDDCPPYAFVKKEIESSVERTLQWARRCRTEYIKQVKKRKLDEKNRPKLIAVIQGGLDFDLRKKCADGLLQISQEKFLGESIPFAGYGFGGRPVDEQGNFLYEILDYTAKLIPDDKLKFALGIGLPLDIVRCHEMGWNMFDCVIPTREGRHGKLYQFIKNKDIKNKNFYKEIGIKNSKNSLNLSKINESSKISDLKEYSFAYLHHLFRLNESFGHRLASLNNLEFYSTLINALRRR